MANGEHGRDGGGDGGGDRGGDRADTGLPRHTTPTWEVELLISGVAVFAMLQLPGSLDDAIFALSPRLGVDWIELAKVFYVYARSAAMILAATFVIHLLLRARWIALVGMHSVYPDGILWHRLRMGPVQRRVEADLDRGTDNAIEAADNRATAVFAIGVALAVMIAIVACMLLVLFAALIWARQALHLPLSPYAGLLIAFAAVMVPFAALSFVDRRFGKRLDRGGRGERMLEKGFRLYSRLGMGRGRNRIMALLGSHAGERKVVLMTVAVLAATIVIALASYDAQRNHDRMGGYALFPAAADVLPVVESAHYDDQRDPARDPAVPFVQSAIATGPYLRLVVPYQPRRDAPALQRECAAAGLAERVAQADARARGLLECLQRLHPVVLDGTLLPDLRFEVASDPRTDRPALVAMIDLRGLAQGRHELRIGQPPQAGSGEADPGHDDTVVRIAFWR